MGVEFPRKIAHILGFLALLFISIIIGPVWYAIMLAALIFLAALMLLFDNPLTQLLLTQFEREHHKKQFPGKGVFLGLGGLLLATIIFPAHLVPAHMILALADAASTLGGKLFGTKQIQWTKNKTWAGTFAFFIVSGIILSFYTKWWVFGALLLAFLESIEYSPYIILDDNLIIPLATGAFLALVMIL